MFGLRCKDTQAKTLFLGKGLPTLEAVITKAETEGHTRRAQDKLSKGMKQDTMSWVSAVEINKAKTKCKFCTRTGHERNPYEHTRKKFCKAYRQFFYKCEGSGHFANVCTGKKRMPRKTPWPQ